MNECPHPEKHRHRSRGAAWNALASIDRAEGVDLGLKPYRCGDHWHLGHSRKRSRLERLYSTRRTA